MPHRFVTNSNGDAPETLIAEFRAVLDAARALDVALRAVTVHGRNYQTIHNSAECLEADANERRYMVARLKAVEDWALEGAGRAIDQKG